MRLQPYPQFDGRCEKAVQLYKTAVEAEVQMMMWHGWATVEVRELGPCFT